MNVVVSPGTLKGLRTLAKVRKMRWFSSMSKIDGRRRALEWIWKDALRVAETWSSKVLGGQGADFPRRVAL